ncbi:MAG: hypothetical protein ACYCWE_01060 [Eubacteriales bacterium]
MKKFIILFLIICMAVSITACSAPVSETSPPVTVATSAEETEASRYVSDDLADTDYEKRTFTALVRDEDEHYREYTADEETGDIINDSIYTRTRAVEERFNIELEAYKVSEGNLNGAFTKSVKSGDYAFDIGMQHMIYCATLAAGEVTINWYDVPNINFEKPWWTSSSDELTVDGVMYVAASDLCLNTFEMTWMLIFNKQLIQDYKNIDPYQLVREGKWTLDNFSAAVTNVSNDLNGDSVMDDKDFYGINSYGGLWLASIGNFMWASGQKISEFDENGVPYFAMDSEKMYNIVDKIYNVMCQNDNAHFDKTNGQDLIFWKQQALFASCMVRDIEANRDKDTEYGMVPYPKYDETQEKHLTLVDGHASMMLVPVFASDNDLEFIGTIVEALSAEAYNSVLPAYYETAMQIKFARDENFPEMLEIIRLGRTFNFGYVYDTKINRDILPNLIFYNSTDLASKLAAAKDATNTYYEKILSLYS